MIKPETSDMTLTDLPKHTSEDFMVTSLINAKEDLGLVLLFSHPFFRAAVWVYKITVVVILVLGVFGNTMTLILQRRVGRGSDSGMSVFISSLAVSDLAMLCYLGVSLYLYSYEIDLTSIHEVFCRTIYWLMYVIAQTSSWILVAMTLQRAASILWPHIVNSDWTARKAKITVLVIVVASVVLNFHIMYGHRLQSIPGGQRICLVISKDYGEFFDRVWPSVSTVLSSFAPFVLLISANVVLVMRVRQALKEARQTLTAGSTDQLKVRQQKTFSMTLTLLCVSVAFLVLTSPLCLFSVVRLTGVHAVSNNTDVNQAAGDYLAEAIGNVLALANNAINFYIYILTGSRYRAALADLCGCRHAPKERTMSMTMSTAVTRTSDVSTTHP